MQNTTPPLSRVTRVSREFADFPTAWRWAVEAGISANCSLLGTKRNVRVVEGEWRRA